MLSKKFLEIYFLGISANLNSQVLTQVTALTVLKAVLHGIQGS